jgi:hypothetical protein
MAGSMIAHPASGWLTPHPDANQGEKQHPHVPWHMAESKNLEEKS